MAEPLPPVDGRYRDWPGRAAIVLLIILCGCGPYPIQWERWKLGPVPVSAGEELRQHARLAAETIFAEHVGPEGVLRYRIPSAPHPESGRYLDLADQACWTGYLLAALVFEQLCEPSPETALRIARVVEGMALLEEVTGVPGLIARCVAPRAIAPRIRHREEDWRDSPTRRDYAYRADVSKDQYSGYAFGLAVAASLLPSGPERERCVTLFASCARHLDDGDLLVRDADGEVTRFGDLRGRIWGVPIGVNSSIALAILRGAASVSADRELERRADARTEALVGSLTPLHFGLFGIRNYSNALMAAVSVGALAFVERDPLLRARYRAAFIEFLIDFEGEGNAFFYSVGAAYGVRNRAEEAHCLRNLYHTPLDGAIREIPATLFEELPRRWIPSRKWSARSREALPLAARPPTSFRWKSDPYSLDSKPGAKGELKVSPVDYLCAYWFGRLTGWIPAPRAM